MFSKISAKDQEIHPLYKRLTEKDTNPKFAGKITWNFNNFLIDINSNIAARFDSGIQPESEEIIKAIERLL